MQPFKYKPKVNSGDLRHRIDIFGTIKFKNEINQTTSKFEKLKSIDAAIIPQTGNLQKQQADTILTNVTHKIIVRYNAGKDIKENYHIKFRGKKFNIKYILNPYFKDECLEIFVEEVIE